MVGEVNAAALSECSMAEVFAVLHTLDKPGQFRIEAPAYGVAVKSQYPENRIAKVLDLAGIHGCLTVVDGRTGKLRSHWNIGALASHRTSEGTSGFKCEAWTEIALKPLLEHAQTVRRSLQDQRSESGGNQFTPRGGTRHPSAESEGCRSKCIRRRNR